MSQELAKIINHSITRLLSRREHSRFELLQKLIAKGHSPILCEQQLQLFIDKNIQSDDRFVEVFVRSAYYNGKGPQHIRQSLKQHNIDGAIVKQCILDKAFNWYECATNVRIKRFGENLPNDFTDKQKQMRFLQYRGFEQDQINAAFK